MRLLVVLTVCYTNNNWTFPCVDGVRMRQWYGDTVWHWPGAPLPWSPPGQPSTVPWLAAGQRPAPMTMLRCSITPPASTTLGSTDSAVASRMVTIPGKWSHSPPTLAIVLTLWTTLTSPTIAKLYYEAKNGPSHNLYTTILRAIHSFNGLSWLYFIIALYGYHLTANTDIFK